MKLNWGLRSLCVLVCLLSWKASVSAAEAPVSSELLGTANMSVAVETAGGTFDQPSTNQVAVDAGVTYGWLIDPHWEPQVSLGLNVKTGTGAQTKAVPMVELVYNFSEVTRESFYLGSRLGPLFEKFSSSGNSYIVLAYTAFLGRRIPLITSVSWAPEVGIYGTTSGSKKTASGMEWQLGSFTRWSLTPFRISVQF